MNDDKTNLDEAPFSSPEPFLTHVSRVGIQERHLPHWQLDGAFYFVTSRLVDSLPVDKLQAWRNEKQCFLREHPKPWDAGTLALYRNVSRAGWIRGVATVSCGMDRTRGKS